MAGQGMHQSQNLSLQQVLAPQLQQSLLILQAPLLELRNLVQQEMETNPVLEELANEADEQQKPEEKKPASSDDEFKAEFDQLAKLDEEWRDYMAQSSSYSGRSQEAEDKRQFFFDSIATQETLQQHLMGQLNQTVLNGNDRKTAELIIGNIDDNGFLQADTEEMSLNTGMRRTISSTCSPSSRAFIHRASAPATCGNVCSFNSGAEGKGAASNTRSFPITWTTWASAAFPRSRDAWASASSRSKSARTASPSLIPRPGAIFAQAPQNYVLPDVTVEKMNGEYQVILNGEQIPHLRISNTYKDIMSRDGNGSEVKDYIRDKIRSGKFLIKSIHQRQQTISNIAHQIVSRQRDSSTTARRI